MAGVAGAVLCGGRSTRMGRDKATLRVDGEAMVVRVATALVAAGCVPITAIGGDAAALTELGVPVVADLHPGQGPLGGVLTALTTFAERGVVDAVVVVSCDMPWLDGATVATLIAGLADHDVAVARGERAEPLCAVWRVGCVAGLRTHFGAGIRAVHRAIGGCDAVEVDVDPAAVRNVNAPADVQAGRRAYD